MVETIQVKIYRKIFESSKKSADVAVAVTKHALRDELKMEKDIPEGYSTRTKEIVFLKFRFALQNGLKNCPNKLGYSNIGKLNTTFFVIDRIS